MKKLLFLLLIFFASPVWATTYYVRNDGHYNDWKRDFNVNKDRDLLSKVTAAFSDPVKKAEIEKIVNPVVVEPIEELPK